MIMTGTTLTAADERELRRLKASIRIRSGIAKVRTSHARFNFTFRHYGGADGAAERRAYIRRAIDKARAARAHVAECIDITL